MLRFKGEKVLRTAHNDEVTVSELQYGEKVYCKTHINFETSVPLHESFENLCARYGLVPNGDN